MIYKIRSLKNREFLQVNHELHQVSKAIVEEAKRTNAVIVVGRLKGIRKKIKGDKRVKRLINNFPYYRLVQYVILVGRVKEFVEEQLETIAQTKGYKILEARVMPDHIHLFIEADPFDSPTNIVP
jgi:IS605 OrfB family transposase